MTWRTITNHALSSLFEPPCAVCSTVLLRPLDGAVCDSCWAAIAASARATAAEATARSIHERIEGGPHVALAAAIGEYEGCLRDIIHALKYDRRRSIAPRLGKLMRIAGARILEGAEVVVPVPLHPRRERSRGFNQADDLARALGLPVRPLLRRVRHTTPQIELPADDRHRNVRDAFAFAGPSGPNPDQRLIATGPWSLPTRALFPSPASVVVLIDDVSTTGATLEACARVLKAAGATEVRALTAARVATVRR